MSVVTSVAVVLCAMAATFNLAALFGFLVSPRALVSSWFWLSRGYTCCVCVREACKCKEAACYQETAMLNRGNSPGLLQADFQAGDAGVRPRPDAHFTLLTQTLKNQSSHIISHHGVKPLRPDDTQIIVLTGLSEFKRANKANSANRTKSGKLTKLTELTVLTGTNVE